MKDILAKHFWKLNYALLILSTILCIIGIFFTTENNEFLVIALLLFCIVIALVIPEQSFKSKADIPNKTRLSENEVYVEFNRLRSEMRLGKTGRLCIDKIGKNSGATTRFHTVFIGLNCNKLDIDSLRAVLAHELVHVKGNHTAKAILMLSPIMLAVALVLVVLLSPFNPNLLFLYIFLQLNICNFALILLNIIMICSKPIHWPQEYEADLKAAQLAVIGKDNMIKGLREYSRLIGRDFNRESISHPSVIKRIAYIESNY